jgi:NAD(P)-dependent dehydrogenase (short-subunit alcohol dehydrogenase family)
MTTAFVTGASPGIGQAIALALGRAGYELALTRRDMNALAETLRHPDLAGRKVLPLSLDLSAPQSIAAAFDAAVDHFGAIDLLVNNAGRALVKPAVDIALADWNDVLDTNLRGTFFLSQRFGRHCMEQKRPGAIVTIASTHGITGIAGRLAYGVAKAGLIQMTKMLAIEWAEHEIRANAIAPATVLTPSRAEMLSEPAARQKMLARIPTGRFVTPEEVAAAVIYLASDVAASLTGHTLVVDGGLTAY